MSAPTTVLVVDDHPLFRRGVRQLLELTPGLACAGEASDGGQALALACEDEPDLILMDLQMRGMDGLTAIAALREAGVQCRIVVLTVSDSDEHVVAALRAGADGYLLKDMEPEALQESIREAAEGELVLSERLTGVLARAVQGRDPGAEGLAQLTPRERAALGGLARGLSNKRIAQELSVSEGTVKVHVRNLLRKMGLRSRVEAAVWAVQHGIG